MTILSKQFQDKYNKKSESDVQNEICHLGLLKNWLVIRFNSGAFVTDTKRFIAFYWIKNLIHKYQNSGLPDVIMFKNDNYLMIEVKRKGGKLRESQIRFAELCKEKNVTVHTVESLDEFINILNNL